MVPGFVRSVRAGRNPLLGKEAAIALLLAVQLL